MKVPEVAHVPGAGALKFASRWFDPAIVHRTFEPLIADWQREWIEATASRRSCVHVKGAFAFCVAAAVSMPAIIIARAPKSLTDRVTRRIAWTTAGITAVLMIPFFREIGPLRLRGLLILFAIPQAMTLAFPFTMVAAVDAIRHARDVAPHVARATTAKLAVFAVVFMAFNHGWVVPAANQAWRNVMFRESLERKEPGAYRFGPARGVRELTTSELITASALAPGHEPGNYADPVIQVGPTVFSVKSVRVEINNRATLAVLPVFLLWRRWRALDLPVGRWWSPRHPILATIAALVLFVSLRGFFNSVEQAWSLPAGSGAWIELTFLAVIGMMRVWLVERLTRDQEI
jgi:hypothetical protein